MKMMSFLSLLEAYYNGKLFDLLHTCTCICEVLQLKVANNTCLNIPTQCLGMQQPNRRIMLHYMLHALALEYN